MLSGDIELSSVTSKPGYLADWKFDDSRFNTYSASAGFVSFLVVFLDLFLGFFLLPTAIDQSDKSDKFDRSVAVDQYVNPTSPMDQSVNPTSPFICTLGRILVFLSSLSCKLSKISLKYREMVHVICFLKGLNDTYNIVRTQILLMDPLPNINRVFSLIMQKERQERQDLGVANQNQTTETKILASTVDRNNNWRHDQTWKGQGRGVASRGQGRGRGRNLNYGKQCSHCNKMNHTVDACYSKHGYPPWYKKTDSNQDIKEDWSSINACQSNSDPEGIQSAHQANTSAAFNSFTLEQMQKLLKMLKKVDEPTHKVNQMQRDNIDDKRGISSWILDTGATDHVTHDKRNFVTFHKIKPISIRLPNNAIITVEHAGTVQFSKIFVIFNVLYIPDFCFNLISVQSLIKDLNCSMTFSSEISQIRENSTLKMIGYANLCKGLYHLQDFPNPDQSFISKSAFSYDHVDVNLWHYRLPSPVLNNKTPYDLAHNVPPTYLNLKVFASTLENSSNKLDPRARKGIFLGYKGVVKVYIVLDINTKELFISRNFVFYEDMFPYRDKGGSREIADKEADRTTSLDDLLGSHDTINYESHTEMDTNEREMQQIVNDNNNSHSTIDSEENHNNEREMQQIISDNNNSHNTIDSKENHSWRRSNRVRRTPRYLSDYVHQVNQSLSIKNSFKTPYLISDLLSYDSLSEKHLKYTMVVTSNNEPQSCNEAKDSSEWAEAMQREIRALQDNNTWYLTQLPPRKKTIGCRWVYKIKYKADGTIERYKAYLVAKGYTQQEGIDYLDTFSPVAKLTTVRLLIALTAYNNWFLHQLDVDNVFLHGDLNEEVYMEPPPGLNIHKEGQVCRLTKSLYGLKQANRQWFEKLSSFLIFVDYVQSKSDHSLFIKRTSVGFTALLVYVDDIIVAGN
ncbi:uncharacterized protein LOC106753175 [Vigna radiata var. radiata]|uniref:Uncharacterized protein LOC106753175 n=1 Tax=Vigna radiata var. radiata TaxID=3916 RepID=A0A1S3T9M0_VIGRR|nr:uncharacterized protein LOC106753175 [Vigna radiata var. radiata]